MSGLQPTALSTNTQAHKWREKGRETRVGQKDKGCVGGERHQEESRSVQQQEGAGGCRGWQERARTSQREGQNARQEQEHRVRSRREVEEGRCKDRGTGQGQRRKDRQSQRIKMKSNRAKEGMDRDGDMQGHKERRGCGLQGQPC